MRAAQIATAVLIGVVIVCGTILLAADKIVSGWIITGFGLFGFLTLLSMIITDRRA